MFSSEYYAQSEKEKEFDSEIRKAVHHTGSRAEMALYIQNQTILNMLRHMEEELAEMKAKQNG